jgi:hypothetical protein
MWEAVFSQKTLILFFIGKKVLVRFSKIAKFFGFRMAATGQVVDIFDYFLQNK